MILLIYFLHLVSDVLLFGVLLSLPVCVLPRGGVRASPDLKAIFCNLFALLTIFFIPVISRNLKAVRVLRGSRLVALVGNILFESRKKKVSDAFLFHN